MSRSPLRLVPVLVPLAAVLWAADPRPGPRPPAPAGATAPVRADTAGSGSYTVDAGHSSLLFRIRHLGVSWFYGRFNSLRGQYTLDLEDPSRSSIELVVDAASVDTNSEGRDRHVRSADFLDVEEHPEIRFTSTEVTREDDGTFRVTGELFLHGVTREVEAEAELVGHRELAGRFGPYRSGLEATLTIARSDFGILTYVEEGALGDEMRFTVSLEGVRRD